MTWKDGRKIIEARRARVAALRLRGLTQREIMAAFEEEGFVNPETEKPFSKGTIAVDFLELDKQWQANAMRSTSDHKAEQVSEIDEVIRVAWERGSLGTILKALERKARVLGLDAPEKHEMNIHDIDAEIERELAKLAGGRQAEDAGTPETKGD